MADREEILRVGLDHLHFYESARGTNMQVDRDRDGVEKSRGHYHVQLETAKELDPDKYGEMSQTDYNAIIGQGENAEAEGRRLAALKLEDIMEKSRIDFSGLTVGESVAFLSMNYNSGLAINKTTQKAFRFLADARNRNSPGLNQYIESAIGLIDLTRAFGERSDGIMNRTNSHKRTARGNLDVDSTMQYTTNAQNRQQVYQEITDASAEGKVFTAREEAMRTAKKIAKSGQTVDVNEITGEVTPGIVPTTKPEVPQGVTQ